MPNRIIKESIRTSDSINELSWFEECLFYRLIVSCDDYGRFDGRPAIIKGSCFPLKDNVTVKAIKDALDKLATAELVNLYIVDGKPYLSLPTWERHQTVRAKKSKYPSPNDDNICNLYTSENICNHMRADVTVFENPNPNTKSEYSSARAETALAPVEAVPLADGSEWQCPLPDYEEYVRLYPGVDVAKEFRKIRAWSNSNKEKRKTRRGVKRFVNGWLSRAQDEPKKKDRGRTAFSNAPERSYGDMADLERRLIEKGDSS